VQVSKPATANQFLRYGLWVEGKHVQGRKVLAKPIRCMKCQTYEQNHIAATCKSIHDLCAWCGEMHKTVECMVSSNQLACSNCRAVKRGHRGHRAADHSCPIFQDKLQITLERNPDAKYPYFLIAGDAVSW
ncbi:hypothetical protein B0H17DRAFT_836419, partial [Mycena rosella]